jgi:hypothetical protein
MKSASYNPHLSPRRFTRLYIIALSFIALLSLTGLVLIQMSLFQSSADARVVNYSSRQSTLSQQLAKVASTFFVRTDPAGRSSRTAEMRSTLNLFETEHRGLINGDATLGLTGNNSPEVKQLFNSIQPDFDAITTATKNILNKIDRNNAVPNTDLEPDVNSLLSHEANFMTITSTITAQYQHEAENRVTNLKVQELVLTVVILLVLVLEAYFIFRPAVRKLQSSITKMLDAEKGAAAKITKLEHKNSELELAAQEAEAAYSKAMPPARVVSYGHYQVQSSKGNYYTVRTRNANKAQQLECECTMYQQYLVCSHSLAAATLHGTLVRDQNLRKPINRTAVT